MDEFCSTCKWRNISPEENQKCIDCRVIIISTNYEREDDDDVEHVASKHEKTE